MKVKPNLSLVYDTRSGDSDVGVGWGLSGLSQIKRCGTNLITHGSSRGSGLRAMMH